MDEHVEHLRANESDRRLHGGPDEHVEHPEVNESDRLDGRTGTTE